MKAIIIDKLPIMEVENKTNVLDMSNFINTEDGAYAIFDGMNYVLVFVYNYTMTNYVILPAKYITHGLEYELHKTTDIITYDE